MGLLDVLRGDFQLHGALLKDPGLRVLAAYRSRVHSTQLKPGIFQRLAVGVSEKVAFAIGLVTRTTLLTDAKIGERLHLIHAMNVTIAPGVEIGDGVGIMHQVTIGPSHEGDGVPKIGNRVFIGAGASILCPVNVGAGAMIFAVGVPAKAIRWSKPSNDTVAEAPAGVHAQGPIGFKTTEDCDGSGCPGPRRERVDRANFRR
jgi:serine acetyltransferase